MWIDQSRCFEQAALGGKYGVPEAKEGTGEAGGGREGSHCWGVLKLFSVRAAFFFFLQRVSSVPALISQ